MIFYLRGRNGNDSENPLKPEHLSYSGYFNDRVKSTRSRMWQKNSLCSTFVFAQTAVPNWTALHFVSSDYENKWASAHRRLHSGWFVTSSRGIYGFWAIYTSRLPRRETVNHGRCHEGADRLPPESLHDTETHREDTEKSVFELSFGFTLSSLISARNDFIWAPANFRA